MISLFFDNFAKDTKFEDIYLGAVFLRDIILYLILNLKLWDFTKQKKL